MTASRETAGRGALFDRHRRRLFGIAYRMLGSKADAEDMLQEAYLRFHQVDTEELRSPEAWLVSVVTRLCIDRLRAAAREREAYPGPWLPEPLVSAAAPSPEEQVEMASSLSMAFLVMLERLTPEERAAFLLHDVFDCGYSDIARILGKTEAGCRQFVHRARQRVRRDEPRFEAHEADRVRLVEQFAAAIEAGDQATLLSLFTEDATLTADGGGKIASATNILRGPDRIARLFLGARRKARSPVRSEVVAVNGEPGLAVFLGGRLFSVLAFETDGQRIRALFNVLNPDKLKSIPWEE